MVEHMQGKVALVTGGASGIGIATALSFARKGAKVIVADVNVDSGQDTVRKVEETGGEGIFIKTDVSNASDVEGLVTKTVETYGSLDYAFNGAGILNIIGIAETTEEEWDTSININLKGVWLCMKYEILQMQKQGSGAVVNASSIAGLVAMEGGAAYIASKHGVIGLTKSAALQYAQQGIRVNAVCPGFIRTPMIQMILDVPEIEATIAANHPIGRLGTPEEIAEAVVWLCSDAASYVTGHALSIDGGYVAR